MVCKDGGGLNSGYLRFRLSPQRRQLHKEVIDDIHYFMLCLLFYEPMEVFVQRERRFMGFLISGSHDLVFNKRWY